MNVEAIIWAVVFIGGVALVLTFLLLKAMQADREEARRSGGQEQAGQEDE